MRKVLILAALLIGGLLSFADDAEARGCRRGVRGFRRGGCSGGSCGQAASYHGGHVSHGGCSGGVCR